MKTDAVRRAAMALPETTEEDHHGFPSFRVRGKIFATLPDDAHLHIMLDERAVASAIAIDPKAFEELYWGKKLAGLRVALAAAKARQVSPLLAEAWRRKAPRKLAASLDELN